jgi:hypothetical protein
VRPVRRVVYASDAGWRLGVWAVQGRLPMMIRVGQETFRRRAAHYVDRAINGDVIVVVNKRGRTVLRIVVPQDRLR